MNKEDFPVFVKTLNVACEMTGRKHLSDDATEMYFRMFRQYDLQQFTQAVQKFLESDCGRFPLTPAAILDHIGSGHLNADKLIAMATHPRDITGYLANKLIGSYDLENNPRVAKDKAQGILDTGLLDRELDRVKNQGLTSRELERLPEFGIDPKTVPTTHRLEG